MMQDVAEHRSDNFFQEAKSWSLQGNKVQRSVYSSSSSSSVLVVFASFHAATLLNVSSNFILVISWRWFKTHVCTFCSCYFVQMLAGYSSIVLWGFLDMLELIYCGRWEIKKSVTAWNILRRSLKGVIKGDIFESLMNRVTPWNFWGGVPLWKLHQKCHF